MAFHLNFPAPGDGQFFAAPRLVAHCPGTHAYFARPPFPMWELMSAGANIGLGTDSLASGDTLSMFEMMRMAGRAFPFLDGPQLLGLATTNPGKSRLLQGPWGALGVIDRYAAADFVLLETPALLTGDLRAALMAPEAHVAATYIAGAKVSGR